MHTQEADRPKPSPTSARQLFYRWRKILPGIAGRLRQARVDAGLTQQELAHRAGLAIGTVSKLEGSRGVPSLAVAMALASALGVSLGMFDNLDNGQDELS